MRVRVIDSIGDLADDLRNIAVKSGADSARIVRSNAEQGNRLAATFARESAGSHGRHYHRAFSAEMITPYAWEYGPDMAKPQGGMATGFEWAVGRQTTPHQNLNRSADIQGPKFADDVSDAIGRWFW